MTDSSIDATTAPSLYGLTDVRTPHAYDHLSPSQELILEYVAARFRLGHAFWPVGNRFTRQLALLAHDGWIRYQHASTEKAYDVRLTPAAQEILLIGDYVPPIMQQRRNPERPTGAIVPVSAHLQMLASHYNRFTDGDISALDLAFLVRRTARHLERACYCDLAVCCPAHDRHVTPHQNCFLR